MAYQAVEPYEPQLTTLELFNPLSTCCAGKRWLPWMLLRKWRWGLRLPVAPGAATTAVLLAQLQAAAPAGALDPLLRPHSWAPTHR